MSTIPIVSQLKSLWYLATFDTEGAKKTWNEFTEAWSHPGQQIAEMANGVPIIGHIKGVVHLIRGETDEFWKAEENATRTLVVLGAGALTVSTGGLAAPVLAGVVAGLAYDGITTGIESLRHRKFEPQGYIAAGTEVGKDWRGGIFDVVTLAAGDGWVSSEGGATRTTKVYRVEGESYRGQGENIHWYSNRRLFPDGDGVVASPGQGVEYKGPQAIYYPKGNKKNGKVVFMGLADPAKSNKNMLFLNFGERARADAYYSQRMLQYKSAVDQLSVLDRVYQGHRMRIKSFRIMTRAAKDIQRRSITEAEKSKYSKQYQGILEVDVTKSRGQYGCERRIYTPILRDAIRGSYVEFTPWVDHLPYRIQHLIVDNQIAYGHVRTVFLGATHATMFLNAVLAADFAKEFADHLKAGSANDPSSLAKHPIPLSHLNNEGIDDVQVCDVPVLGLRHSRHAKCGRQNSADTDHGQHFEYLAELPDGNLRWYPSPLVANDLKDEFEKLSMQNALEVAEVIKTDGDKLTVRRRDNSEDTVLQTQMFWREEEPGSVAPLADEEIDALLHHAHTGQDYDRCVPATLAYHTDWAKVETSTPGTTFRKDAAFEDKVYEHVTFSATSVMFDKPNSGVFRDGVVPFIIVNTGSPIDISISHGRDGLQLGDEKGRASAKICNISYSNETSNGETNSITFRSCPVLQHCAPAILSCQTDWAMVETTTPGTTFRKSEAYDDKLYQDHVTFSATSVMIGKRQSRVFRDEVIPFIIVNNGAPISLRLTHGRDGQSYEDLKGRAGVNVRNILYSHQTQFSGDPNDDTWLNCPVLESCAPAVLSCQSDWAMVETDSPGTILRKSDAFNDKTYDDVLFNGTSIMIGQPDCRRFRNGTVPFVIVNNGTPVNISITHGRDGYELGDWLGRATVVIRNNSYVNEKREGTPNYMAFQACPVL